jgi:hypothetical protein
MELWQGFKFREEKKLDPNEKQGIPGISDFSEFLLFFKFSIYSNLFFPKNIKISVSVKKNSEPTRKDEIPGIS